MVRGGEVLNSSSWDIAFIYYVDRDISGMFLSFFSFSFFFFSFFFSLVVMLYSCWPLSI